MSNPQDPQDPYGSPSTPGSDPQNPYGTPPPPPPDQPTYGQPTYGQTPPPPYGQPGQPGQPGQVPYVQGQPYQPYPQYGGPQQTNEAPKGMAITALVLSFLGCTGILAVVSIVLSVIVLRRGKDGRNHGKGLAISAIVVSLVTLAVGVGIVALGVFVSNSISDVQSLKAGQCITASGLLDEDAREVSAIATIPCDQPHDGEVVVMTVLTADQADSLNNNEQFALCGDAIDSAGKTSLFASGDLTYTSLTPPDPATGDRVACVAYRADGQQLDAPIG